MINAESFASTIGSCSHNSIFLRDGTEAIFIPRAYDKFEYYQQILNQVHPLKEIYIDSSLSIFSESQISGDYFYITSKQLRNFFGDKFYGYDEEDLKNFSLYVEDMVSKKRIVHLQAKEYYRSILPGFMAQFNEYKNLIAPQNQKKRPSLNYKTHVDKNGWGDWIKEEKISNSIDKMRDIQAIKINFAEPFHDVYYAVYYSKKEGWSKEVATAEQAGTTGKSKAIKGIKIRLDDEGAKKFDILYRVHKFDDKWTAWAKNGEELLSDGQKFNALQIKLEDKVNDEKSPILDDEPLVLSKELLKQPGKIAIQAHIFYLDLLEEMVSYCANMPYKFDALISIVDETATDKVQAAFAKIKNAEKVIVRVVPNRGRDVAPFLVGFGDVLGEYDFIAHIHSKKSLYSGEDKFNWRKYLFNALLGNPKHIRKIFRAFADDESVGVIYPRPADDVPYNAFTWLSNRGIGRSFLKRADIAPNKTDYFDFPAGTMFWTRTAALKKIFNLNLTVEDFPPEQGQNDGTIAHVFERSILLAAQSEGMKYYEFDPKSEVYTVNYGCKNIFKYLKSRNGSEAELKILLNKGEIVSFDIFDTLIMRYVAKPSLVNEIIRFKVEDLLGKSFDFPTMRLKAEEKARQIKTSDVNLDDIYKSFAVITELDDETCQKIREIEVSTELKLILPRQDVVNWFKEILKRGRKIWLISDMYMQTPDIERLLKKCGVEGYEKLLISCETGMRKDTAAIWNHFVEKNLSLVHVGDNEMSDIQLPSDRKLFTYHLMSSINLLSQVPFGGMLFERLGNNMSLYSGILLGIVLAKKFQSPFRLQAALTDDTNRLILHDFRELGYWFYGVPILTYILWLIKKTKADGVKRILFLAREGYFLQSLYKFVAELLNIEPLPNDYFLASRRSVTVSSIRKIEQAEALIKLPFRGSQRELFNARFGLELGGDEKVFLPNSEEENSVDYEGIVNKIIDRNAEKILRHAASERANFEKYIANFNLNNEKIGIVDIGYSGTIQYHLQELTGKTFTGYYFATSSKNRFGDEAGERMRGCFTENDDYGTTKCAIYRFMILFETILTSPDAQLKHFDAEGKPVFGEPEPMQGNFESLLEVQEGIKDFCRDVAEIFGDILLRVPIDINFADAWVRAFVKDTKIIAPNLRRIYQFDDVYCNLSHGNALDRCRRDIKKGIFD